MAPIALLTCAAPAICQTRYRIELAHSGDDQVGQRVAFELREAIRASAGMRLDDGSILPRIVAHMVSIDSGGREGVATAISVSIVYDSQDMPLNGALITAFVQSCGSSKSRDCARDMLASIDSHVTRLKTRSRTMYESIFQ